GADRLVVDLGAGGGVVVGRPLGHQRIDEGSAGARDLGGIGVGGGRGGGRGRVGRTGGRGRVVRGLAGGQGHGDGQGEQGKASRLQVHHETPLTKVPAQRQRVTP